MTTTIADGQKKNTANVLEVFGSFRVCFQQWSNLVSVRRQTSGWKYNLKKFDLENVLEKNDPSGIPDLGLRDRLASLGAKLLPDLNGLMGEPAISQPALAEIMSICESARDNTLLISPQPGKYLGPAFDVLEADLRGLSGSAKTTVACPDDPTGDGEWSAPLSQAEIARRITGKSDVRSREIAPLFNKWHIEPVSARKVRIRLDTMNESDRAKIENPNFFQPLRATSATTATSQ